MIDTSELEIVRTGRKGGQYVMIPCSKCNKDTEVLLSSIGKYAHHFCSRDCYYSFEKKKPIIEAFDCLVCGEHVKEEDVMLSYSSRLMIKKCSKCRKIMYNNKLKERKRRQEEFRKKWKEFINESNRN
jgi:hypothetical protein